MVHESVKTVAEFLALRSVDSMIEGVAVCLFGSLMLRMIPTQNAATRFAVWFCALLAIAGIPIVSAAWSPAAFASGNSQTNTLRVPESWAVYFLIFWAVGSLCLLSQVAASLWHFLMLRRSCVRIDATTLDPIVQETLRKHGGKRSVTICTSNQVRVPAALGLWHPIVVVPEWAMKELSADDLNHVVLHELAHLQRWDDWTNLAQQMVKAVLFFHPAVWWIEKKAALEREIACDDAVLAETSRPRDYAECLARLAEKSFAHRTLAMAQAALGRVRQMSTRVARILDGNRSTASAMMWRPVASAVAVFAIGCGVWLSRSPKLLAFEGKPSTTQAVAVTSAFIPASNQPEFKQGSVPVQMVGLKFRESRDHMNYHPTAVRAKARASRQKNLIHSVVAKSSPPITETMWIVVESQESVANRPVVQIEMLRVTILHVTAADSIPRIPRKI